TTDLGGMVIGYGGWSLDHHGRNHGRKHAPGRFTPQARSHRGTASLIQRLIKRPMLTAQASSGIAGWIFHVSQPSRFWLVSFLHIYLYYRVLEFTQCYRLDEEQAIPKPKGKPGVYLHSDLGSALLGPGNIRQLCILQPYQRSSVCQDKAV